MENSPAERPSARREEWDASAPEYESYSSGKRLYRESAGQLVRLAGIEPGMTVVDLACGTGIVTEAILQSLGGAPARVIGVDFSPEMLSFARRRIDSDEVEFYCRPAESFSGVVGGKVDRVVCNAAFWHFDTGRVLAEISKVLKPSGRCLLTLPADSSRDVNYFSQLYQKDKCIWMVIEEKELRGYLPGKAKTQEAKTKIQLNRDDILQDLPAHGLRLCGVETIKMSLPPRDFIDFLRIPIMTKCSFLFRGVPEEEAQDILSVVANELEWVSVPDSTVTWAVPIIGLEAGGG